MLNSSDWLAIQIALEGEIKRMKEYENDPYPAVAESASNHIKRYEIVLKKMGEMGLR